MANLMNNASELAPTDFLNRLRGHVATLLLSEGSSITGKITEGVDYSSAHVKMVHVTELEGRDYYDAVIAKHSIVGFIFRRPGM